MPKNNAYWTTKLADQQAERDAPAALRERLDHAHAVIENAAKTPPKPGSLAAMCIGITGDLRDRDIRTFAVIETDAVLDRVATAMRAERGA